MENEKSFFYKAHCEGDEPSSKRLWGGIGFATVQVCLIAATVLSLVKTSELSSTISSLLDFDLITSASLIGLNTIMRTFNGGKTTIEGETKSETKKENAEE